MHATQIAFFVQRWYCFAVVFVLRLDVKLFHLLVQSWSLGMCIMAYTEHRSAVYAPCSACASNLAEKGTVVFKNLPLAYLGPPWVCRGSVVGLSWVCCG